VCYPVLLEHLTPLPVNPANPANSHVKSARTQPINAPNVIPDTPSIKQLQNVNHIAIFHQATTTTNPPTPVCNAIPNV
jgi:hypothetical protein